MTKPVVLILNHTKVKCGVYQFGKRVYELAARSTKVDYVYRCLDSHEEYVKILSEVKPNFIVYNWHWDRMPWLKESDITSRQSIKHYFIYHDGSMMKTYDKYLFFGDYDPKKKDAPENKRILLPRPLFPYNGKYPINKTITIGSFGFAFIHKKFPDLVKMINSIFSEAVINIHMTLPYFGDTPGNSIAEIAKECHKNNIKPRIKLNITQDFLNDEQLLTFLAGNDINVFAYSDFNNPGLSSAIDYALSVKRPIAITKNMMFRHIVSHDILLTDKNSIKHVYVKKTAPLEKYYKDWSIDNFTLSMENLFINETEKILQESNSILFVNHKIANCGVYQFGKRVYELAKNSPKFKFVYKEVESIADVEKLLNNNYKHIVFNWHRATMPWVSEKMIKDDSAKHYFLFHEEVIRQNYDRYMFFGDYDIGNNKIPTNKSILLPRPLFKYKGGYPKNEIFTIGSFGFGFWQKGFHTLVERVNKEFDKAIINLHIPHSHFGDPGKVQTPVVIKKCIEMNKNRNIKLNITQNFLTNEGILKFLANNDVNAFLYSENGEGLSSATDYALSVKRPIVITNCQMFRHFRKPQILAEENSIMDVYNRGTEPLEEFYEKWSVEKFIKEMEEVFNE